MHREIFEKVPDGITIHDPADGSILYANERFCEMLGYDPIEPSDLSFEDIHHDEAPHTVEQARSFIRAAATDGPQTFEWVDQTADGDPLPVEVHLQRTTIDDEERILAVVRDITERDRRQRELERVRSRLELALKASDLRVWEVDPETGQIDILAGEQTDSEWLGLGDENLESLDRFLELVHPKDRELVEDLVDDMVAGMSAPEGTVRVRNAETGELVWIELVGEVRTDPDGSSLVGTARNVTERVRRERELERQNERLEEFASVVSHDLRNPLNVAIGNLELARETGAAGNFDATAEALDRMRLLIDDMLTLARDNHDPDAEQTVVLARVAERCWDQLDGAGASLSLTVDHRIRADPSKLSQLVSNLLQNAIDHAGPDATITIGGLADGFYVADDGPGIPPAERADIVKAGYSTSDEGTGFGLRIVLQIAEAHGWELSVGESEAGGAQFDLTGVTVVD